MIVWSHRAAALGIGSALGEVCFHHSGPVFICLVDDAPFQEELDDSTYRLIDLSIDDETLRCAQRTHELIAAAARERRLADMAERARRQRMPTGRAFGGGALAGFATSVALLGAAGATAISAADQLTHEAAAPAETMAQGRVLSGMPQAPKHEAWMDVRPAAPQVSEVEATQKRLDAVATRIAGLQEADRRAHLNRVAARTTAAPVAARAEARERSVAQSHPLSQTAEDPQEQSLASNALPAQAFQLATTPARLAEMDPSMKPVAELGGEPVAPIVREDPMMIGIAHRGIAMGPPEAEDIEGL
jgi:hypothetical protein